MRDDFRKKVIEYHINELGDLGAATSVIIPGNEHMVEMKADPTTLAISIYKPNYKDHGDNAINEEWIDGGYASLPIDEISIRQVETILNAIKGFINRG